VISPYPYPKAPIVTVPPAAYTWQSVEQRTTGAGAIPKTTLLKTTHTPVTTGTGIGEPPYQYTTGNVRLSAAELAFMETRMKAQVAPCKKY
jgi:hypothetical protein